MEDDKLSVAVGSMFNRISGKQCRYVRGLVTVDGNDDIVLSQSGLGQGGICGNFHHQNARHTVLIEGKILANRAADAPARIE